MEEDGQTTPFWLQSSTYFNPSNHQHRRRRPLSSICLNSGVLIVILSIVAMITIFFLVPSFTSQTFRPILVRKNWDSLNLVLVLFAILCGILGRRKDDGESNGVVSNAAEVHVEQPVQQQWFGYSDEKIDESSSSMVVGRLKRNSSSYPDLRQVSSWASPDDNWRFYDDSYVHNHRRRHRQEAQVVEDSRLKTLPVDINEVHQQAQPPPPSRRQPSEMKNKTRHTFQSVAHEDKEMEFAKKTQSPTTPPPPPPPPPPEVRTSISEKKGRRSERKKSKDIASTFVSLYNQTKRKRKQKSRESFDDILRSPTYLQSGPPPSPPPPPPPPPPPASVFHQLFKKGSKSRRIHSVSVSSSKQNHPPPPPPPPPPPMSPLHPSRRKSHTRPIEKPPPPPSPPLPMSPLGSTNRKTQMQRQMAPQPPSPPPRKPMTPGKPPLPSKITSFYDETYGNQSPLTPLPMPPPPPPPPFKMPGFKFVVQGDYVKLLSSHSTRSNSPDLDSVDTPPTSTPATPIGGDAGVSVFCPSPDVDTKADTFIARFKAGLRMEKVKSFMDNQDMGTSGPSPSPLSNPNPT